MTAFVATGSAFLAVLIIQACAQHVSPPETKKKFELKINERQELKDPENFCNKMKTELSSSAIYVFEVVQDNGKSDHCCEPSDCSAKNVTLKVDRITTSRIAKVSANTLTPIGSHVTQRIYSDVVKDIAVVDGELKSH